jgi:hypothetical protein
VSVSLCSNIEGHTNPVCFVNENENDLIEDMLTGLNNIRNDVVKLTTNRWANVFEQLDNQISEFNALVNQSDESDPSNILKFCKKMLKDLEKLKEDFTHYCYCLPVLGFNSSRYDINLAKQHILKALRLDNNKKNACNQKTEFLC